MPGIEMRGALAALFAALVSSGCARGPAPVEDFLANDCGALFARIATVVDEHRAADVQANPVPGHPHLRVTRFAAAARPDPVGDPRFGTWVRYLRHLARGARRYELDNIGAAALEAAGLAAPGALDARLDACAQARITADLAVPARREALAGATRVPSRYVGWKRALGLYPLASIPFRAGIDALHADVRARLAAPPASSRYATYRPGSSAGETAAGAALFDLDPLDPATYESDAAGLALAAHAPIIEVEQAGDDDRIGWPVATPAGPRVDALRPTVFTALDYTPFGGRWVPRLSYVFWFPARTASGPWDLLAGPLDGLTLRVTLGPDGSARLLDTMHNCGCYHLFLATSRVRVRAAALDEPEPVLVVRIPDAPPGRPVIRLAAGTHYVQRVSFAGAPDDPDAAPYALVPYDSLRSQPAGVGSRRSLFAADGLVSGSERAERFVFWPMGVPSPGAMRQSGHHAIAFIGERHFDNPGLLDRYFETLGP